MHLTSAFHDSARSVRAAMFRLSALTGWTSLPYLPLIRHRTLIVCGNDDPVIPNVNHRVMARLIPSARLHTVDGGGHLVLVDSAHQVGPVITAFLRGANERPTARRRELQEMALNALSRTYWRDTSRAGSMLWAGWRHSGGMCPAWSPGWPRLTDQANRLELGPGSMPIPA